MLAVKQAIELNSLKLIGFENDNLSSWKAFYSHGKLNFIIKIYFNKFTIELNFKIREENALFFVNPSLTLTLPY